MQQKNLFIPINFERTGDFQFNAFVNFEVKQINFRLAYNWFVDDKTNYYTYLVRSDMVDGDVIGHMSDFKLTRTITPIVGPAYDRDYYSSSFQTDKCIKFLYKDPVKVNGSFNLNITETSNNGVPNGGFVLLYVEFLSEYQM